MLPQEIYSKLTGIRKHFEQKRKRHCPNIQLIIISSFWIIENSDTLMLRKITLQLHYRIFLWDFYVFMSLIKILCLERYNKYCKDLMDGLGDTFMCLLGQAYGAQTLVFVKRQDGCCCEGIFLSVKQIICHNANGLYLIG